MKNFISIILKLVVLFLLLASCDSKRDDSESSLFNKVVLVEKENLFETVEIIELEINENSIVSFPLDLCVVNDNYIISSRNNTIKVFDKNGKFLKEIGALGLGPGEYMHINALFSNGKNSFGIFDDATSRLSLFDLSGKLIRSTIIKINEIVTFRSIVSFDGFLYFHKPFTEEIPYHVYVLDTLFNYSENLIPASADFSNYTYNYFFNGSLKIDSKGKFLYELNSFHNNYIYKYNLVNKSTQKIPIIRDKKIEEIPPSINDGHEILQKEYQMGTSIYNFFILENNYFLVLFIDYLDGRGIISSSLYNSATGLSYSIKGNITPDYSDGTFLYDVIFLDEEKSKNNLKTMIKKYRVREFSYEK